MKREFLNLIPKSYLCPFCGWRHEWREDRGKLGRYRCYDNGIYKAELSCDNSIGGTYSIYFSDNYLYYYVGRIWETEGIKGRIPISSIKESSIFPRVTFNVHYGAIEITLGFEFEESDYNSIVKISNNKKQ